MPNFDAPALPAPAAPPGHTPTNRIATILVHTPWYSICGQSRLAADLGVSRSTVTRIVSGRSRPSVALAQRIAETLSHRLGRPLSVEDIFSEDGSYTEPSGCRLCGCGGCMPDDAYDRRGNLKLAFRNLRPGDWSLSLPRQDAKAPLPKKRRTRHSNL